MSILKRGALDTYTSICVLALVCDCLSTEALRAAICQVPQTLEAMQVAMLATLGMASATPRILLLHQGRGEHGSGQGRSRHYNQKLLGNSPNNPQ